jgi:hypothetical protein
LNAIEENLIYGIENLMHVIKKKVTKNLIYAKKRGII